MGCASAVYCADPLSSRTCSSTSPPATRSDGSAFAFVDRRTGDLIKPGGWAKPQRDKNGLVVRFNLERSFELAVDAADPYGSFLYKR